MVSKRCLHRSNLHRAICHSFKNFLSLLFPVIDLTRSEQAFQLRILRCAPVWCFSFRSLFNLQGTRPTTAEQSLSYHMSAILSTTFFAFFWHFSLTWFWLLRCLSRTARLDYHTFSLLSTPFYRIFSCLMALSFSLAEFIVSISNLAKDTVFFYR